MDMGNIIKVVIAGVVLLVVVMVVVIPVLQDASYDTLGTNEATYYFEPVADGTITVENGNWLQGDRSTPISGNILLISDSMAIQYSSGNTVLFDYAGGHYGKISSITISGNSYTTTGNQAVSGTLGNNPVIVTDSADSATIGRFANKPFYLDKANEIWTWKAFYVTDSESNQQLSMRILTTGTVNDTDAYGVAFISNVYTDVTSTSASLNSNSYTEPNDLNYRMTADPTMNYSVVYDGATYTAAESVATSVFAPLEFTQITDTGHAIKSMVDIVPLLMIVGVILMIIGMIVIRRS